MKKIFLKDIAKQLNLSKATVSLVLNGKGDEIKISQETQQKIINYAKEHNYVPNQLARGLSRGKSETIGLIIPNISDTFYAEIASSIEKKAETHGYTVVFSSSYESPKREKNLIRSMLNRQVDGLIIASTQQNEKEIELLKKNNFPFVLIDRHYPNSETNYVIVDNYNAVKNATQHLLRLGRKKVAFVTLKLDLEAIKQRLLGYKAAINEFTKTDGHIIYKELDPEKYKDDMSKTITDLITINQVDGIIFSTHYLTAMGIRELKSMEVKIPEEIAIISFDEMKAFDLVEPPVTCITQPREDLGYLAVDILLNEINKNKNEQKKNIVLQTKFKIRKSCGI